MFVWIRWISTQFGVFQIFELNTNNDIYELATELYANSLINYQVLQLFSMTFMVVVYEWFAILSAVKQWKTK
jgi:hypothetical protein